MMGLDTKVWTWLGLSLLLYVTLGIASPIVTDLEQSPVSGRLIGGAEATPHEFPWQVSLEWDGGHVCGGVIVNQSIILTSAACADLVTVSSVYVLAGRHMLNESVGDVVQKLSLTRITIHPDYRVNETFNDIAVFRLVYPIEFNENIRPITMAQPGQPISGPGIVTGWGAGTEESITPSNSLMKATLPIISDSDCELIYGQDFDGESMICAGEGGLDFCTGDDGGPLIAQNEFGAYVLIGISSWGYGCGKPGFPGVYTEVSFFQDFILQNS